MHYQSILFGNGLNLLSPGNPSWDQLLKELENCPWDKGTPNTLRYESYILAQPYRVPSAQLVASDDQSIMTADKQLFFVLGEEVEFKLKQLIANEVSSFTTNPFYKVVSRLPVKHFITTNYENLLLKEFGDESKAEWHKQERYYSISRYCRLDNEHYYWPIHGNINAPKSIMLGYDHYCGALSKINSYIKGINDSSKTNKVESILYRIKEGIEEPLSWIDLLFMTDIHIIGQGLDYAEVDLWWLLNKRRRYMHENEGLIDNKIVYYPDYFVNDDKRRLLNTFGVEINDIEDYDYPKDNRSSSYAIQLDTIRKRMLARLND